MANHIIGTREEWLAARLKLLEAEKELTRRSDEVAIVTASALKNRNNAQAAPTSRFARDIRVLRRVPLPLRRFGICVVARKRQELPWIRMEKNYRFEIQSPQITQIFTD
jgi:predicted dithiol-disulfide oxidoreductase (DUF899 family)